MSGREEVLCVNDSDLYHRLAGTPGLYSGLCAAIEEIWEDEPTVAEEELAECIASVILGSDWLADLLRREREAAWDEGWVRLGTHVDVILPDDRALMFSDPEYESGLPKWERIVTRADGLAGGGE